MLVRERLLLSQAQLSDASLQAIWLAVDSDKSGWCVWLHERRACVLHARTETRCGLACIVAACDHNCVIECICTSAGMLSPTRAYHALARTGGTLLNSVE